MICMIAGARAFEASDLTLNNNDFRPLLEYFRLAVLSILRAWVESNGWQQVTGDWCNKGSRQQLGRRTTTRYGMRLGRSSTSQPGGTRSLARLGYH
jgi:hypothetical protein